MKVAAATIMVAVSVVIVVIVQMSSSPALAFLLRQVPSHDGTRRPDHRRPSCLATQDSTVIDIKRNKRRRTGPAPLVLSPPSSRLCHGRGTNGNDGIKGGPDEDDTSTTDDNGIQNVEAATADSNNNNNDEDNIINRGRRSLVLRFRAQSKKILGKFRQKVRSIITVTLLQTSSSFTSSLPSNATYHDAVADNNGKGGRGPSARLPASVDDHQPSTIPVGPRWATARPGTDLSGTWKPVVTPAFLGQYDAYLQNCGTSYVFRQVCLKFCGTTRETVTQTDGGRMVRLRATSPAGGWDRTLLSSGTDNNTTDDAGGAGGAYEPVYAKFLDPDGEPVVVEAWWDDQGSVHHSFMRGKASVCGGEFESRRFLETIGDGVDEVRELVCESTFHPSKLESEQPHDDRQRFKPAFVRWRYRMV